MRRIQWLTKILKYISSERVHTMSQHASESSYNAITRDQPARASISNTMDSELSKQDEVPVYMPSDARKHGEYYTLFGSTDIESWS